MNILIPLIPHSNREDKRENIKNISTASFPLGTAYIVAAIRHSFSDANIKVVSFDLLQADSDCEIRNELWEINREFVPDFILLGAMITRFHMIMTLSQICRDYFPDAVQVLGGGAATWGSHLFNESQIDFFTIGESEESIIKIMKNDYKGFLGIIKRGESHTVIQQAVNLDKIPIPSHSDFNVSEYIAIQKRLTGWKTMPIVSSRGCPYSCRFCTPSTHKWRVRSVDNVIEEISLLKINYGIDSISFWDELQFVKKPWFEDLCNKLIANHSDLKWSFVTRATLIKKEDIPLLKLARKAGCLRISVGIESGNEAILEAMNKNTAPNEMAHALRAIRQAGIKASGSMLLGFDGESKQTISESIAFCKANLLETSFYNLIPLPGSKVYESCFDKGLITDEKEYISKVSSSGGDASNIIINLTAMDDLTYAVETVRANNAVKKVNYLSLIRYYGILFGFVEILRSKLNKIRRKIYGRIFDTP